MKNRESFIKVLCILEGFKVIAKEFHWMENSSHQHELLDSCGEQLLKFQDTFAEQGTTIWGKITQGDLVAIRPVIPSEDVYFDSLIEFITGVSEAITKNNVKNQLSGLQNLTDEFISAVRRLIYLGDMD